MNKEQNIERDGGQGRCPGTQSSLNPEELNGVGQAARDFLAHITGKLVFCLRRPLSENVFQGTKGSFSVKDSSEFGM